MKDGHRLKALIEEHNASITKMANKLNTTRSAIYNRMESNVFQAKTKQEICNYFSISISEFDKIEVAETLHEPSASYEKSKSIKHIPIEAEAGFIGGHGTVLTHEEIIQYDIPRFNELGFSFEVKGQSMEPALKHGYIVITGRKHILDVENIATGELYVIVTKENILIKRIRKENDHFILISDNEKYEDIRMNDEDILFIYKVRRLISYDLKKS